MARFIFRLEALLRHRKLVEERRQADLAVVQKEVTRIETELRRISESLSSAAGEMRDSHLVGRLNMQFIAAHRRFGASLQRQGMALAAELAQRKTALDAARAALADAAKERKIVEKLKERQLALWQEDQARREMTATDEIGMQLSTDNLGADI